MAVLCSIFASLRSSKPRHIACTVMTRLVSVAKDVMAWRHRTMLWMVTAEDCCVAKVRCACTDRHHATTRVADSICVASRCTDNCSRTARAFKPRAMHWSTTTDDCICL